MTATVAPNYPVTAHQGGPGRVSSLATAVHVAATVVGVAAFALSAVGVVPGTTDRATGIAAGLGVVLGAAWRYLRTHDAALAGNLATLAKWGAEHAGTFEQAVSDVNAAVAALPPNLRTRLDQVETAAQEAKAQADQALSRQGLDPAVLSAAVRAELSKVFGGPQVVSTTAASANTGPTVVADPAASQSGPGLPRPGGSV